MRRSVGRAEQVRAAGRRRGAEAARAPAPAGAPHTSPVKSQWFRCIPTPATVRQPLMIARGVSAASGIRCPYVCQARLAVEARAQRPKEIAKPTSAEGGEARPRSIGRDESKEERRSAHWH